MASGRVAVVADSACDLPPEAATSAGVRVVPLIVSFGTSSFRDGVDLTPRHFWQRVASDPAWPTTASPSPEAILEAYRAAARAGAKGVVSVHVSARLSRTADSARMAAEEATVPVEIVDSRSVSMGEGLVALAAARAAGQGADIEAVAGVARRAVGRLAVAAVLDTVDFLRRGGRLGRAKAAVSDLLRIRPVLSLEDGEPVLAVRARTRSLAIAAALERVAAPADLAAVFHAGASEAREAADRLREGCGAEPLLGWIGAATGTHLGPRALGFAVLRRDD